MVAKPIILADNQVIFRAGAASVLANEGHLQVVAQCADMGRLKEAVARLPHSIVVFPSSFASDPHDLHAVLAAIEGAGGKAVVVLEHGAVLELSVAARVAGVMLRSVGARQLVDCLSRVAAGERVMPRASIKSMPGSERADSRVMERLTPREIQVIALLADGCKNREIAERLATREQVVKNYLRIIYDKTGVSDRLELTLFAINHKPLARAVERARSSLARSA
jgi:DNA-binding NarL/FixJ family response regulator